MAIFEKKNKKFQLKNIELHVEYLHICEHHRDLIATLVTGLCNHIWQKHYTAFSPKLDD